MTQPGRKSEPIYVERLASRADDFAPGRERWERVHTTWAWIKPLTGRELENAKQMEASVDHRMMISQWGVDLTPTEYRIRHITSRKVYNIKAVLDERMDGAEWTVYATEVV